MFALDPRDCALKHNAEMLTIAHLCALEQNQRCLYGHPFCGHSLPCTRAHCLVDRVWAKFQLPLTTSARPLVQCTTCTTVHDAPPCVGLFHSLGLLVRQAQHRSTSCLTVRVWLTAHPVASWAPALVWGEGFPQDEPTRGGHTPCLARHLRWDRDASREAPLGQGGPRPLKSGVIPGTKAGRAQRSPQDFGNTSQRWGQLRRFPK